MQADEPRSDMNVDGLEGVVKDEVVAMAAKSRKRKRMEALNDIQSQHGELEANFLEEKASLQAKYQKLYNQLYIRRYEIVNGEAEPENVTTQSSQSPAEEKNSKEKGVPDFWLTAMKTNEVLIEEIEESDEQALKFLKDIRWCKLDDTKGFQLDFYFDLNPFFRNRTLTKIYHISDGDGLLLEKITGTKIEWYQGKCLTKKILVKTPRKKSKNMIPKPKIEKCKSFFNFFDPPQLPEDGDIDENDAEDFQTQIKQDYDIGTTIRDTIIPYAISLFTGVASRVLDPEDPESGGLEYIDEQTDDDMVNVDGEERWTSPTSGFAERGADEQ